MIGIPCTQIPKRPLPMSDLALAAAGITVPGDHPVGLGIGIDLFLGTTYAFWPQMIHSLEIGLMGHDGR